MTFFNAVTHILINTVFHIFIFSKCTTMQEQKARNPSNLGPDISQLEATFYDNVMFATVYQNILWQNFDIIIVLLSALDLLTLALLDGPCWIL